MKDLYWLFLTIPLAWLLQNIIHEFSHLLTGKIIEGRKMKKLIFWPHKYEGRFYFARYESGSPTRIGHKHYRHFAPVITAAILCFFYSCPIAVVEGWWKLIIVPFAVAALVDMIVWIIGYCRNTPFTDGYYYRLALDSDKPVQE